MFGGKPIRSTGSIKGTDLNEEDSYCTLSKEMRLNPDDVKRMMNDLFKSIGMKDKDIKEAMNSAVFQIDDSSTHELFYFPGVPTRIENRREVNMNIGFLKKVFVDERLERRLHWRSARVLHARVLVALSTVI